jgi:hypothetical protein
MSTQGYAPRPPKFAPAVNIPEVVAIATIPGRMVASEYGPSEVVFDLTDGRPWYVPQVIADEIYRAGIGARQQIEVTALGRKKTEVRIVPIQAPIQPAPDMRRASAPAYVPAAPDDHQPLMPVTGKFMAAYKAAIDTLVEAKVYAQRQGLAIDIRCEDVRCLAATIMIDAKGGR